ncbi:hypothetical protein ACS8Y6_05890 [Salinisphaera sp. RV14]|uniref:hypothetical protein n=1 Tax=unclassified Salinisphaera TaxID=2649847 RepID=UPI003F83ABAF
MYQATTGADVLDYIEAHGLKRLDACWLLGITPWRFGKIVKEHESTPLHNPSFGVLLRLIEQWPEQAALPEYPRLMTVFERVHSLDPRVSRRVFGMALGCHPSWASSQRLEQQDHASAVIDRILLMLERRLDQAETEQQAKQVVDEWLQAALAEWHGRDDARLDFLEE